MKHYQATPLGPEKYLLGESPFYDPRTDLLSWVDIKAHRFYRRKGDVTRVYDFGEEIGAAVPAQEPGTYLVCGTHAIYTLTDEDRKEVLLDLSGIYDAHHRSNDASWTPGAACSSAPLL